MPAFQVPLKSGWGLGLPAGNPSESSRGARWQASGIGGALQTDRHPAPASAAPQGGTNTLAAAVPMSNANSIKVEGLVAPNQTFNSASLTGLVDATCVLGPPNSVRQRYGGLRTND